VGAQQPVLVFGYEEGVLHVAGRVAGLKVQGREIVVVVLNFRTEGQGETHSTEDIDNPPLNTRQGVAATEVPGVAGQEEVGWLVCSSRRARSSQGHIVFLLGQLFQSV